MNLILSPSGLHVAAREHPTLTVEEIECLLRRQDLQEWLGLRNMVAELESAMTSARRREVLEHYSHGIVNSPNLNELLKDKSGEPLRMNITEGDKKAIIAFLGSLTDYETNTDVKFSNPFKAK